MQQQQRWHLLHRLAVRPELRSFYVKEEFYVVYLNTHEKSRDSIKNVFVPPILGN